MTTTLGEFGAVTKFGFTWVLEGDMYLVRD